MQLSRISTSSIVLAAATVALLAYTVQPASADVRASATRISTAQEPGGNTSCVDTLQVSPVLMMNTAGYTLLGPYMTSLTVYSNGLVITSEAVGPTGASAASQRYVQTEPVQSLARDLRSLGAFRQCDETLEVADLPLTTVTVFNGDQSARAHTYSYWIGNDEQQAIRDRITNFVIDFALQEN